MKKQTTMIFLNLLLVIVSGIVVFHYYPILPEEIPTHYGLHGPPDSGGCKSTIFTMLTVQAGLVALLLVPSLLVARYPWMYNFPVDPKTLSDVARDELYNQARRFASCCWYYRQSALSLHHSNQYQCGSGCVERDKRLCHSSYDLFDGLGDHILHCEDEPAVLTTFRHQFLQCMCLSNHEVHRFP